MFLKNVLLSALLANGLVLASPSQAQESALSYDEYLSELKQQAVDQGISQGTIDKVFEQIKLFKKAVVNDSADIPPENLDAYLPSQVSEALVEQARSRLPNGAPLLWIEDVGALDCAVPGCRRRARPA